MKEAAAASVGGLALSHKRATEIAASGTQSVRSLASASSSDRAFLNYEMRRE